MTDVSALVASAAATAGQPTPLDGTSGQVDHNLIVEWDADNDGDFDETEEDLTDWVLSGSYRYGRDFPSQITGRSIPGSLRLTLNNSTNRFSRYRTDTPLTTSPFSLKSGTRIRVRTSESDPVDPTPLLRDRFSGTGDLDGSDSEDGKTWTVQEGGFSRTASTVVNTNDNLGTVTGRSMATVDLGQADYYIQARVQAVDRANRAGVLIRYVDDDNFEAVYLRNGNTTTIGLTASYLRRVSGETTILQSFNIEPRSAIAIGALVDGNNATIYVDGVPIADVDLASANNTETKAGIYSRWRWQSTPDHLEVMAWTDVRRRQGGIVWSGTVSSLETDRDRTDRKVAYLTAEGDLARLDREASTPTSIGKQTGVSVGTTAGQALGNVLGRVGALHPPGPIEPGGILGGFGFGRAKAITQARRFEETELGFLYELPEGGLGFEARDARENAMLVAEFTDSPGTAEFRPVTSKVRTNQRDIINRVTSEVAAGLPRIRFSYNVGASSALGVGNYVRFALPTAAFGTQPGDLFIAVFASTIQSDGVPWLNPVGWTNLRPTYDELGLTRVYAKTLTTADLGQVISFYDDTDNTGGAWHMLAWVIEAGTWHGSISSAVSIAGPTGQGASGAVDGTNDPPTMLTPWGQSPTLYMAGNSAMVSSGSGPNLHGTSDEYAPNGFFNLTIQNQDSVAGVAYDVAMRSALFNSSAGVVNPSPFTGNFSGFTNLEAWTIAVRPFAGDPPPVVGGVEIESNNVQSQHDHGSVVDHREPSTIQPDEDAALEYNDLLLKRYDQDRPYVRLGWYANASSLHRYRARTIRLSDLITITDSDEGINENFFVEAIGGDFSAEGGWWAEIDCSPAVDPGNGADVVAETGTTSGETSEFLTPAGSAEWLYAVGNPTIPNPDPSGLGNTVLAVAIGQGTTNAPSITITAPSPSSGSATEITGLAVTESDIRVRAWYYTNDGADQTFGYSGGSDNRTAAILIPFDGEATAVVAGGTPVTGTGPTLAFPGVTTQVDDRVVAIAGRRDNGDTAPTPTGYTIVDNDTSENDNPQGGAWSALATTAGTTTPPSITWSASSLVHAHMTVAFRGAGSGNPGVSPPAARIDNADLTIDLDATDSSTWDNTRSEGQWQIGGGRFNPGADDNFGSLVWEADDETILWPQNMTDGTDEILQSDTYQGIAVVNTARQYVVDGSYETPAEEGNDHGDVDNPPSMELYFDGTRATMTHSAIPQTVGTGATPMIVGVSFVVEAWMYADDWTAGPFSLHSPTIYHTGPIGCTIRDGDIYLSGKYSATDIDPDSTSNIVGEWTGPALALPPVGEWFTMVVEFVVDPGGDGYYNWYTLDQATGVMSLYHQGGSDFGWKFDESDPGYTDENENFYFNLPSQYEFHQYTPAGVTENWDAAGAANGDGVTGTAYPNTRRFRWAHATAAQAAGVSAADMIGHAKYFLGVS